MNKEEKIERMMQAMLAKRGIDKADEQFKLRGFERFYLYTNEHLSTFLKKINVNGKRVLTVGSSGDQILYSLLNGAREVVCFDICPFTEYYYKLKVACITNLSYEEYDKYINNSPAILSPEVYRKVSHDISGEARDFWDHLFLEGFNHYEFNVNRANIRLMGNAVYMNNKDMYNKLQKVLRQPQSVMFIETDIRDIPRRLFEEDKYDVILLSNIIKYAHLWNSENSQACGEKEFLGVVKDLSKNLNPGGVIQIDYAYDKRLEKYAKYCDILGNDCVSSSAIAFKVGPILYRPKHEDSTDFAM